MDKPEYELTRAATFSGVDLYGKLRDGRQELFGRVCLQEADERAAQLMVGVQVAEGVCEGIAGQAGQAGQGWTLPPAAAAACVASCRQRASYERQTVKSALLTGQAYN